MTQQNEKFLIASNFRGSYGKKTLAQQNIKHSISIEKSSMQGTEQNPCNQIKFHANLLTGFEGISLDKPLSKKKSASLNATKKTVDIIHPYQNFTVNTDFYLYPIFFSLIFFFLSSSHIHQQPNKVQTSFNRIKSNQIYNIHIHDPVRQNLQKTVHTTSPSD